MKYIINADDFGKSKSVNDAIVQCFAEKLITNATIMVNMPCSDEAVNLAKENGFFEKIGLHLNITEGKPLTEVNDCGRIITDSYFNGWLKDDMTKGFLLTKKERLVIENEINLQMEKFLEYGFMFRHLDSHHHVHTYPIVLECIKNSKYINSFDSIRISRNISVKGIKGIYKKFINRKIRKLCTCATDYFGNFDDYLIHEKELNGMEGIAELMSHPYISEDGCICNERYGNMKSWSMTECVDDIKHKGMKILY